MTKRVTIGPASCLRMPGIVLADQFEACLVKHYKDGGKGIPLLIDFQDSEFIDICALLNLLASAAQRKETGLETFIGLPSSRRVRDFLNVWRFPEAYTNAVGMEWREAVVEEDQKFLSESQVTYSGIGNGINKLEFDPDWKEGSQTKRNFFEFTWFRNETGDPIRPSGRIFEAPRLESKRWHEPLIREILNKHLPGGKPKDDLARVIMYEAMSNAVRHPMARNIDVVSKFDMPHAEEQRNALDKTQPRNAHLRICVWDDGDGIAQTLKRVLERDLPIQSLTLPLFMTERIHVQLRTFDKSQTREEIVDESEVPQKGASESRILLSSLFPGISRAAGQAVDDVAPFDESVSDGKITERLSRGTGMGLYALRRTALDQFQGRLLIRSGEYRLFMEVAHDRLRKEKKVRYKCKITRYPKSFPTFKGNLLAIQLPVVQIA